MKWVILSMLLLFETFSVSTDLDILEQPKEEVIVVSSEEAPVPEVDSRQFNLVGGSATIGLSGTDITYTVVVGAPAVEVQLPILESEDSTFIGWFTEEGKQVYGTNLQDAFVDGEFISGAHVTLYPRFE